MVWCGMKVFSGRFAPKCHWGCPSPYPSTCEGREGTTDQGNLNVREENIRRKNMVSLLNII